MLGWFQALMPKEMRFFDLFDTVTPRIVVAGAESLRGLLLGRRKRLRAILPADFRA